MRMLQLIVSYDGTDYAGWQVQPDEKTVQGTLESAIEKITGESVRVLASGRTDAGVHALGQVVGWRTESKLTSDVLRRALNAELPHDMAVLDVAEVEPEFHAIRDALKKRYRYLIHDGPVRDVFRRRYCWQYRAGRLDVDAMSRAADALRGKHDFASFQTSGAERATTVRTVFELAIERGSVIEQGRIIERGGVIEWGRAGDPHLICLEIEADGFLYNMVRTIVGTLVEVGRRAQPETWPAEVVAAVDRRAAGPTAPPEGLVLVSVQYGN